LTTFSTSQRLLNGAIVGMDPASPTANAVIAFQYNPDTLTRSLTPQTMSGEGSQSEALRLKGPPQETIKIEIEIDAADQIDPSPSAGSKGITPFLASLEMLLYPKSSQVIANDALLQAGTIEIIPPQAPLTLFVWGPKRVLPVRITDLSITEEAFDQNLNPVRAKVSLGMRVQNYQDLGLSSNGGALFMAHQVAKEAQAAINQPRSLQDFVPIPFKSG
jgi:hypothetical protein